MSTGKQNAGVILPEFTVGNLGTSFKVVLINSAEQHQGEKGPEVYIPDYQGLIKKVAVTRAAHPVKLQGGDIRFLRKTLGLKAKDLAEKLDVSPEHLSRCEAGDKILSPNSEKVLRSLVLLEAVYVLKKAVDDSTQERPKLQKNISKLLDALNEVVSRLKIVPVQEAGDDLVLHFVRENASEYQPANDDSGPEWLDQAA